jgi:putative ATP-dependent endonuclease of OLD family
LLIRKLSIENVRSFLNRREISFDGNISILIGPNGGGKTNLLDTLVGMLRRHIFNAPYYAHSPTEDEPNRWETRYNDPLNQLTFEKHSGARERDQVVEIELEVGPQDVENMTAIKTGVAELRNTLNRKFYPDPWLGVDEWISQIAAGQRVTAVWRNGVLQPSGEKPARDFLAYLHVFEGDNTLRAQAGRASLQLPMIYLPVNRAANGFSSAVGLAGYNDYDQKRASDATSSRSGSTNIVSLAIGRMAQRFRLLQENSNVDARTKFREEKNLQELSIELEALGYTWGARYSRSAQQFL